METYFYLLYSFRIKIHTHASATVCALATRYFTEMQGLNSAGTTQVLQTKM